MTASAAVDLTLLKKFALNKLRNALDSMHWKKDLVLDPELMRAIDTFSKVSIIKEHQVNKIYALDPKQRALPACSQRMYIIRPSIEAIQTIADQILNDKSSNQSTACKIFMVPKKHHSCMEMLERLGVYGDVEVDELDITMFVLDTDLITLHIPDFPRSYYLEGNETYLHNVAAAFNTICQIFGHPTNVRLIGQASVDTFELKHHLASTVHGDMSSNDTCFGHAFVFDRQLDFATTLCSQVTYEGILDETFGIDNGVMKFVDSEKEEVQMLLSSQDATYADARDRHFISVFAYLSSIAKDIRSGYEKRHALKTVGDMKEFVGQELRDLKTKHKTINHHINASEIMMEKKKKTDFSDILAAERDILHCADLKTCISFIEECIHRQLSAFTTLRLICLLSIILDGLPPNEYRSLRTQFLHSHGFEYLLTWHNLAKVGLLKEQEVQSSSAPLTNLLLSRKSPFLALCKKLKLIPEVDIDLASPSDMSYVFGGLYSPLLCALVEQGLLRYNFSGLEEVMHAAFKKDTIVVDPQQEKTGKRVVLVVFIGGCTFAETAALRFLGLKLGYRFIVMTTSMLNGRTLLENFIERVYPA